MSSLKPDQKDFKQISEESVAESEVILIQHEKYNTEKYNTKNTTHMYKYKLNYLHQNFKLWRKYQSQYLLRFGLYSLILLYSILYGDYKLEKTARKSAKHSTPLH